LAEGDCNAIWQAIDWPGCSDTQANADKPDNAAFKEHFERLLNPGNTEEIDIDALWSGRERTAMAATDRDITPLEVDRAIKKLKTSKSGGPSGVPPDLLKSLPPTWIVFLSSLFTHILKNNAYPQDWSYARLITLFKKGDRTSTDNYRGISVMDSFGKLYDAILCNRLNEWFTPDREQAGAQAGRGCLEQIVTFRLVQDYARATKKKLFNTFY
jgi:hypothetical protein